MWESRSPPQYFKSLAIYSEAFLVYVSPKLNFSLFLNIVIFVSLNEMKMYENKNFKRDAFIKVTRRRFRDKRSETRASFTNPLGNTTIKIVVQYPATVAAACNILYVDDVELIKEESLDHFTPGGSWSPTYGWTGSNTLTSPAVVSNALRVTNNTPQEGFKRNITLAAKKYTFSFFMDKGLEDLNDKEYFSVDIINSSNAIVYTFTTKVNATGYYNFDYTATTAGTYTWRFRRVSLNGRSSSGIAYFDDFKASYTIQQSQQVCSSPKNYRFGFNTQEKDDEIYGAGNLNTAEFWEYDTRLGRRWNVDPKYNAYESRYTVNGDNPILYNDPFGDYKTKLGAKLANLFKKGEVKQAKEGSREGQWYFTKGIEKGNAKVNSDGSFEVGVTTSRPDYGNGGLADKIGSYVTGATSALGSFAKFAVGGGGTQTFGQGSFEAEEMAKSPGVQNGLDKLKNGIHSLDLHYSFSPDPKFVIQKTLETGNPLNGFSKENKEAHEDVFKNQSWTRLYVGGYSGTATLIAPNQVQIVIRNNTTANSLMLHAGELIFGKDGGAKKFDDIWNKTPFFNSLHQEYKFNVPLK